MVKVNLENPNPNHITGKSLSLLLLVNSEVGLMIRALHMIPFLWLGLGLG